MFTFITIFTPKYYFSYLLSSSIANVPDTIDKKVSESTLSVAVADAWHIRSYVASVHRRVEWTASVCKQPYPVQSGNAGRTYQHLATQTALDANHEKHY